MTKRQLQHYMRTAGQLALVEAQLKRLPHVTDTVKASEKEYPYLQRTVAVSGFDERRAQRLRRKRRYLQSRMRQVERFVEKLPDSYMRDVLRARYIQGLSWVQIGHRMVTQTESIKKAANRYVNSVCKP